MTEGEVLAVLQDALWTCLTLAAPLLIGSIVIGLVVAIFQAATQVNEQTITFVPKILVIALILLALGPWMMSKSTDFFNRILVDMINYVT